MIFKTKKSSQPRKDRKRFFTANLAERWRMMSSPLSKQLREELKVRHVPIRAGDEVVVLAGKHKSKTGVVSKVSRATMRVDVQGISILNHKQMNKPVHFAASRLRITKLYMNEFREKLLARRGKKD